jgi:enoyl-CoA hydratase/carnithine racemase
MPVAWERVGNVGIALIDRPERRNALDADLCQELTQHLTDAPDLGAVVIGGMGDKAFCAGADLGRRASDTAGGLEHGGADTFRPSFEVLLDTIVGFDAPVVAAVNGAALGAGMQLAVACDLRVVAQHAKFGIPAGRLGVVLSASNIQRLAVLIGQAAARDVLLTARVLDIDEAERVGLVQRRAIDAVADARVLAEEIARLAPLSVRGHKRALGLVAAAGGLSDADRSAINDIETAAFESADLQEGLAAFSEKRPPTFEGR